MAPHHAPVCSAVQCSVSSTRRHARPGHGHTGQWIAMPPVPRKGLGDSSSGCLPVCQTQRQPDERRCCLWLCTYIASAVSIACPGPSLCRCGACAGRSMGKTGPRGSCHVKVRGQPTCRANATASTSSPTEGRQRHTATASDRDRDRDTGCDDGCDRCMAPRRAAVQVQVQVQVQVGDGQAVCWLGHDVAASMTSITSYGSAADDDDDLGGRYGGREASLKGRATPSCPVARAPSIGQSAPMN